MKKTKFHIIAAITAILLAALACDFNVSSANIKDAWMTNDKEGTERTTTFNQDEVFYCLVELDNAPDDTTVKATWTAADVDGEEPNTFLHENELTTGSGQLTFKLSNENLWPAGKYKVDLYLNDELDRTLEFEVRGESAPSPTQPPETGSTARIEYAYMARDEAGTDQTTVFSPNDVFYCLLKLVNAPSDTRLKAVWFAVQAEGIEPNHLINETEISGGDDTYTFSLTPTEQWPPGSYKAEIYLNDELAYLFEFEVEGEESPSLSSLAESISSAYMSRDDLGTDPTLVFSPNDVFYFIVTMADTSQVNTMKVTWYAVEAAGLEPNSVLDEVETSEIFDVYTFSLSPSGQWPVGKYMLELYINGELAGISEFEVQ